MGLLFKPINQSGFPFALAEKFIKNGYDVCIETGTYKGQTTLKLSNMFKKVYTIEASEVYYKANEKTFEGKNDVFPMFGDTRKVLPEILAKERGSKIVFWLDAHASEPESFHNDPPILAEIEAINKSGIVDPVIIIDDARCVLMMDSGIRYSGLPKFINSLHDGNRYISCAEDKFIAVPPTMSNILDDYTNSISSDDWDYYMAQNGQGSLAQKTYATSKRFAKKWLPHGVFEKLKQYKNKQTISR